MKSYYNTHFGHILTKQKLVTEQYHYYFDLLINSKQLKKRSKVLDLGCSTGNWLSFLYTKKLFSTLTGIDIDKESIQIAKQKHPKMTFIHKDILKVLPTIRSKFELITAFNLLEHLPKSKGDLFLKYLHRPVFKNSLILLKVPNAGTIYHNRWLHDDITHHTYYTASSLKQSLLLAGFKENEFTIIPDYQICRGILKYPRKCMIFLYKYLDLLILGKSPYNKYQTPTILVCIKRV